MSGKNNISSSLRQRLTLQQEVQAPDGVGGYTRSWEKISDLWAEILPLSGREKLFAMQLQSSMTHRVLVRYTETIHAGQRLASDNRVFNIHYVANPGRHSPTLELLVEEGAAG